MQKLKKLLILIPLAIASYSVYGQDGTIQLKGKVINLSNDVSDVLIVNLSSKKSTITDSLGLFTIEVRIRDSIQFTAVQYLKKQIVISDSIFDQKTILINLVENIINLKGVTVTPYNLSGKLNLDIQRLNFEPVYNSSTLGLPNADVEVLSQGERLLLEADRGKYTRLMTIEEMLEKDDKLLGLFKIGVNINANKTLNRASGRTKSLEEMVARDENIEWEKEIVSKFSKKTMSESFDIPQKNINGFLTYCLAQTDFPELRKKASTEDIWKYLETKSIEFKELTD